MAGRDVEFKVIFNRLGDIADEIRSGGAALCEQTADAIVDEAQATVAVDTGETRDSIHREGSGFGTRVLAGGASLYLEYGTHKMRAQPFFHQALEKARGAYLAGWRAILSGTGQRAGSATITPGRATIRRWTGGRLP